MPSVGLNDETSGLRLRLFGPFQVRLNGAPLPRLRSRKGYQLLALLALRHDSELSRIWLAGTLWPDTAETDALASLRKSLYDLRRALGPFADRLEVNRPRTLRLLLMESEADVVAFDAAIARGDAASLTRAVALHRGPLLEGWCEEWVDGECARREQEYLQALERLAADAMARREHEEAVRNLRLLIAADPLRESAYRSLMQALATMGNYAAALEVYRDLRLLLHRELNAAPDPQTNALFQQIQAETGPPRIVSRQPLRSHPAASPVTAHDGPVHRIPRPLTRLIGRQKEVQEAKTALASARLVTLTGAGGVGKTRLAIQVAQELAEGYADGVWFVDLAALADPALVAQTVAAVMGVRDPSGAGVGEALLAFLRPKEILLILNNCEHLIDACAQLVEWLLSECPHLSVLATSRESLHLTGEVAQRVPSLAFPDAGAVRMSPPEALLGYDAVRLFAERAAAARPGFALDGGNARAAGDICRRLDGIPLAIELAAARVKAFPVATIAGWLDDRFRFLTGGSRSALSRYQTLQASIDWSYHLLSEPEQRLLSRLSVFAGGCTLDAAEAVCTECGMRNAE